MSLNPSSWMWWVQVVVGVHVFLQLAVYLPSSVAALRRRLRRRPVVITPEDLAISVLRPMRGLDPHLEENLLSYARLEVPDTFEVLMLLDSASDEALPIARKLEAAYPRRFRTVIGTTPGLNNPKVASLVHGLTWARNKLIWVTDSNTETSDAHLTAQLEAWKWARRDGPVPTLVHAPLAAVGGSGLGAIFDRLHLGTYNNISAETTLVVGVHSVVGKSLMFHVDDMERVGGLASFGDVTGEDFFLGRAFREVGMVALSSVATRQVLGEHLTVGDFWRRQLRWAATRKGMSPSTFFLLEHFTYFGLLWLWLVLGVLPLPVVLAVFGLKVVVDGVVAAAFGDRTAWVDALWTPVKDLAVLGAWIHAWFVSGWAWRGRRLSVGTSATYQASADQVKASADVTR